MAILLGGPNGITPKEWKKIMKKNAKKGKTPDEGVPASLPSAKEMRVENACRNVINAVKEYRKEVEKLKPKKRTSRHNVLITNIFLHVYGPEKNSRKMLQSVLPGLNALPALDVPNKDWDDFDTTFDFCQEIQLAIGDLI